MRLATVITEDGLRLHVRGPSGFVDVARATGDERLSELTAVLSGGPEVMELVRRASEQDGRELDEAEYAPAVPSPRRILCLGVNYTEHAITLPVTVKPADWFTLSTPANMHASIASNGSSPVLVGLHAASSTDAGPFRITSSPALEDGSSGSGGLHVRHILGLRQS